MRILMTIIALFGCAWAYTDELSPQQIERKTLVQCGNLVYAKTQTSVCFADRFLTRVATETTINAAKKFTPVKLQEEVLFEMPICVFSGEGNFSLSPKERKNFENYLRMGGFILASPGCSDKKWDHSFRRELSICFPDSKLTTIPMNHPIFSMVHTVSKLNLRKSSGTTVLEGLEIDGRLVLVYSKDGLNDVDHAKGCCCCGGNEVVGCEKINVNIFVYALLY